MALHGTGIPSSVGKLVAASGVAASHTGDTTNTTVATVSIPGNSMGPNGYIDVTFIHSWTNNANAKTFWVKFGGTTFYGRSETTGGGGKVNVRIHNRNDTASQVGQPSALIGGWGFVTGAPVTATVDTTTAQDLILQVQLNTGTDTGTFEAYSVEVHYGA